MWKAKQSRILHKRCLFQVIFFCQWTGQSVIGQRITGPFFLKHLLTVLHKELDRWRPQEACESNREPGRETSGNFFHFNRNHPHPCYHHRLDAFHGCHHFLPFHHLFHQESDNSNSGDLFTNLSAVFDFFFGFSRMHTTRIILKILS